MKIISKIFRPSRKSLAKKIARRNKQFESRVQIHENTCQKDKQFIEKHRLQLGRLAYLNGLYINVHSANPTLFSQSAVKVYTKPIVLVPTEASSSLYIPSKSREFDLYNAGTTSENLKVLKDTIKNVINIFQK